jgi:tRNA threonylcarbamoyladenosine modification (KEOPS) complex Cgi121 subunit
MRFCELPADGDVKHMLVTALRPKRPEAFRQAIESMSSDASVQILDACLVAGFEHILTAALLAANSLREGRNLARSPATEVILYASARRQIKEAIAGIGVNEVSEGWVLIALSGSKAKLEHLASTILQFGEEDDRLLEITEAKSKRIKEMFGITEEELKATEQLLGTRTLALKSLVMERVSISELYR